MKKVFSILFPLMLFVLFTHAQRYAVIDTRYILNKMPDYKEAQSKLDQISNLWQQEIEQKQTALNKMQKDFEAEQVILPEHLQKNAKTKSTTRRKNCAICRKNVLDLKAICLKKDRN